MQERFIRYWKVVIATLETYKICVPNNLINKHTVQRGAKQFQIREPQLKQTLAAQDIYMNFCLPKIKSIFNTQETRIIFSPVEELRGDFSPNELQNLNLFRKREKVSIPRRRFRRARFLISPFERDEKRAPLKTPAWEAFAFRISRF